MAFSAGVEFHPEYSVENGGTWGRGGFIDGVTLRNVSVTSATDRIRMAFNGLDAEHAPRNLVVENLVVNGRPIESADQVEMACDAFARPPRFLVDDIVRMNSTEMNRTAVSAEGGSGEVKVQVVGNSIVLHGIAPKIGWTNEWGMAASAKEKDFAHLVVRGIERQTGKRASFRIRNAYELECDPAGYDFCTTYAKDIAWKPDYVVIALGENVKRIEDPSVAQAFRAVLVKVGAAFKEANPGVKTVYRSVFWPNAAKTAQIRAAADATGSAFADLGDMGDRAEFRTDGLFAHKGVAKHPGDRGMAAMAETVLKVLMR